MWRGVEGGGGGWRGVGGVEGVQVWAMRAPRACISLAARLTLAPARVYSTRLPGQPASPQKRGGIYGRYGGGIGEIEAR